jgi:hypothetical protein
MGEAAHSSQSSPVDLLKSREAKVRWIANTLLNGDFDYDGIGDHAVLGRKGPLAVVGIVKGPVNAETAHWTLEFAEGQAQDSLCSVASARIRVERLNPEEVAGTGQLPVTSRGINLFDDSCDSFHIYWDSKAKRFSWWRL